MPILHGRPPARSACVPKSTRRPAGTKRSLTSAGKAVTGNAPTWTKVGAIYGARV
ncbi:hypothetical protein CGZ54_24000 [Enterobacter hormaechei]|uniref:Uncharacterized protein n=1 Tax=Enterobacter hormaechei TaxID=158836 RepID=A0AAP8GI51_9ENTR|nr:hypothetical protein CGZ54_24000 [Enterobacter hormaechei]